MAMPRNIRVIPPNRHIGTQKRTAAVQKTRVAAYCRVSTESEEQETSYEMQVLHYTDLIKSDPRWSFAGVYADDGISGTNTLKRDSFNRMIEDCRNGKIDMIITKSISRFSRNTVDCLKYTRELKDMNVAVFFEKENINTLDAKGEVLMTIMAALAQQESESLSANVRMGIQFRNQMGKVMVNHSRFLGYTKDQEGKLIIVPEEAEVVRRIYREYLSGSSLIQIKRSLEKDGILTGGHNAVWHGSNIKQILTNEKYIGDALLQKTYTVNVLEKKRVRNNGIVPQYYVEGSHEPIISKEAFLKVQAEMARRASLQSESRRRIFSSRYALSGAVCCGHCGDNFRRIVWNNRGSKSAVWRCISRVQKKKSGIDCPARTVREKDLHEAVVIAVNDAWFDRDRILPALEQNIRTVLSDGTEKRMQEIDKEDREKQKELLSAGNDKEKIKKIEEEILALQEERKALLIKESDNRELQDRIEGMIRFLDEQPAEIEEYSEDLARRLIKKVTVYDRKMTVEFKSGFTVDVDA